MRRVHFKIHDFGWNKNPYSGIETVSYTDFRTFPSHNFYLVSHFSGNIIQFTQWASLRMKMSSISTSSSKQGAEAVFENDILPARTWASISRTVVLQMLTLLLFNLARSLFLLEPFLENGSGFPIGWMKSGLNSLIHPSSWFYDSLIIGCVWLIGMLYLQNFQMSPKLDFVRMWTFLIII